MGDDALTMLTAGMVLEEDAFDVLAEEDTKGPSKPAPAAKPMPAEMKKSEDAFSEGVGADAPAAAHVDSRISSLMAMGFQADDAEKALKASLILHRSNPSRNRVSYSPHQPLQLAKNDVDVA